jgi:DNA-binding protein HU-beta
VTKQEFVETLAEQCDLSKAEAGRALEAILDSLTEAMVDGEEVRLTGFGTFLSRRRRARQTVNPQDPSEKIRIRAANVPKFRPGTALRDAASQAPTPSTADAGSDGAPTSTTTAAAEPHEWRPLAERG